MAFQSTDNCVLALIGSFTSGLDVFKKLHKKRKKGNADDVESRLSRSLQRGPVDIVQEYDKNYAAQGEAFRKGDGDAHAALATLALKLNNGLVNIISAFLTKKKAAKPDYARLTILSEGARREAIEALSQLALRLSHSRLKLLLGGSGQRFGAAKQTPKHKRSKSSEGRSAAAAQGGLKKSDIRRNTAANVSAPQLAIVRPKHRRSVSASGVRSPLSGAASPKPPPHRRTQSAAAAPTLSSPRPPATPARAKSAPCPGLVGGPPALAGPAPQQFQTAPLPSRVAAAHYHPYAKKMDSGSPNGDGALPRRRRAEQPTPSVYTFASESTKVGEIPMERWAEPFDFEAMARLNAEAALRPPLNPAVAVGGGRVVKRRGLFGLFRKTAPVEA